MNGDEQQGVNGGDDQVLRERGFPSGRPTRRRPVGAFHPRRVDGLNDNGLSNTRSVRTDEQYELLYFFGLASGHLHELASTLTFAAPEIHVGSARRFITAWPLQGLSAKPRHRCGETSCDEKAGAPPGG
jgi:hypothetical protein